MKSIFLNAKINEITKADEMKSEYWNAADVKIKKIVTSINMIVDNGKNKWENDAIDDNWEKWIRKLNTKRRCVSSMLINIALFVESQYIKISKQIWWTKFKKFWKDNLESKIDVNLEATTFFIDFKAILKLKTIL